MDKPTFLFDKSLIFRQIPLFSNLNLFERRFVYDVLEIVEVKQGELIYRQNDPADALYCIVTGRVQIFIEKEHREQVLEYLHRGKYFGFISLLTGEAHSVSARALTDTVLAKIPKEAFQAILKSIPRLAIDLSQMLSRRLKRKDYHPKSIFESTILGTYSDESLAFDNHLYALNLAYGLKNQTQKSIILVDVGPQPSVVSQALGMASLEGMTVAERLLHYEDVAKAIVHDAFGIDVLRLRWEVDNRPTVPFLVSLLTMLVNDYHFCLVSLTSRFGPDAFKILSQADAIHILTPPEPAAMKEMSLNLGEIGVWMDAELKRKLKWIVLEEETQRRKGPALFKKRDALAYHAPVYATLPALKDKKPVIMTEDFASPYARVIRRISRQVGEVLVGLALGSGSAMGLSHIGVLKVLEQEGIPIDLVVGSSMGALIGALWCSGYSAEEVQDIIVKNKNKKYIFGLDDLTFPLHGLIKGKHITRFLTKYLGEKTFFDVKRPFKIVACDCMNMRQVVFETGRLRDAVLASIAIPGVFSPYRIRDRYYIDGGILNPLPTNVLVEAGAKKIIAVNVLPNSADIERTYELLSKREPTFSKHFRFLKKAVFKGQKKVSRFFQPNIFDVIVSSVQSIEYSLAQLSSLSQSDVTLHPDMTGVHWAAFDQVSDLVKRGEDEAHLHLTEIKELLSQSF
ncbi:MAG: patatin-like phospholipase family protein [Candidatus Omnitrophota bacterium]